MKTPFKENEDKDNQKEKQEWEKQMAELFGLMDPKSQLKEICLGEVSSGTLGYYCKNIADILYCAQSSKKPARQEYCKNLNIAFLGQSFSQEYNITHLALKYNFTPEQITSEIDCFNKAIEELSNKDKQKEKQEWEEQMAEIFRLMGPKSRLRKICLREVSSGTLGYYCKNIADILYCAQSSEKPDHQKYCKNLNIASFDLGYNITNLALKYNLTPKQTTSEITRCNKAIEKLSTKE